MSRPDELLSPPVRVEFVHLKCGERKAIVPRQVKGLSGGQSVRPIARTDIVGCARAESSGGREEAVHHANRSAGPAPAQDNGQIVGVRKSAAPTEVTLNVGSQIVLRERERGGR